MLWSAFAALALFVAAGVGVTTAILQMEKRREYRVLEESRPLTEAVREMDQDILALVSSARGFTLTGETQFLESYGQAVQSFRKAHELAAGLVTDSRDRSLLSQYRQHFEEIKRLTDSQVTLSREGHDPSAREFALEIARLRRGAPDYGGLIADRQRQIAARQRQTMDDFRQWVMIATVLVAMAILAAAAIAVWRIELALSGSIARQMRHTEAMIGGMADGVMLVDTAGKTIFINPAARTMLRGHELGVPIVKHAQVYGFRDESGRAIDDRHLPAAQALATGRAVQDVTMTVVRERGNTVTVSMSAAPLRDEGRLTGVVVTLRDITERKRLEAELQVQAERAQILADASAFFASNIDPAWVSQAVAERIAEVLGDWAAVIVKTESKELRVAAIHHRDMASLGLAWSYIYRQPLTVGDGLIGQVVATGYPSLTTNLGDARTIADTTSYHAPSMKLASLLILPLRTRREILGALLIAANHPERAMNDETLPLAEALAERAALAVENAKLYTEQVEARKKVEDLSRLKDEFLSIASHELRTPVTSIKGYTQLAKTLIRENDLATSEEYLDIALDQIDRMSRLILELLDVSRIETGRLEIRREPIDWPAFVRDVVHRHHTAVSDRRFHIDITAQPRIVYGDRDRLEQVLGNLLENAVKYSPDGSDVFVSVQDKVESVVTSVCDRGIGIPTDELNQVFERFHRGRHVSSSNYGGLGLGLYITKQIIERHSGTIWVESVEGSGTTFYFSLPVAAVDAPAPQETEQTPAVAGT
jgi:signal transduction histidine kinase/PAS domain-containing protein